MSFDSSVIEVLSVFGEIYRTGTFQKHPEYLIRKMSKSSDGCTSSTLYRLILQ